VEVRGHLTLPALQADVGFREELVDFLGRRNAEFESVHGYRETVVGPGLGILDL
jgi:hypothetical protein